MNCAALIVAAGRGRRLGGSLPKQYLPLGEGAVLRHTVKAFLGHPEIGAVRVVIGAEDRALYESAVGDLELEPPVTGGAERQDSVRLGLQALRDFAPERVLIHDAARPFVSRKLIDAVLAGLAGADGALPALAVSDSLKRISGEVIAEDVDRAGLVRAQTPQGFRFDTILAAHEAAAGQALTDDVAVARMYGIDVVTVQGEEDNFKITTAGDLARARGLLAGRAAASRSSHVYRTGNGFDVHRYAAGRPMVVCGIEIPHDRGLAGHSDADVGLHAITDAVLGAIADGDIGDHFPPGDPQWRGASSDRFLRFAADRVRQRGGEIVAVDVTLICETPKMKPHREAMRACIAAIAAIPTDRVSVKATTTEKLGFTGRGEGMAAQATATVALPAGTTG
ncbi:bifunctional 2-C-methyl-D-erythritol 4-phosphate cytidylyltransferase/2-C-methyl-D-erythritol 2,4-cyclodiphosphate synthase [Minwuia thermotolerans]|uniref:Bifunctional enzyme IspD/IspF n=1 Tax=Minwuia thermotolerans TaxID=2056226 RepID=A0A2M9G6S0_9PROT|nr:bifunctional 2-C-methyl-D-erythritol 4-phosphate cytidylyltransferase/2-C-methyl-D-erythritol 2,4-cyclodiphosphate synthase [Minwuia thermotolerans]PJK31415.1 bifunctional 2-C-methyl-D-erythritol 4-phosphate cytidylyltransferase/2-C-methyl-D-erythritol 2,4-cyclodiphosphate synthase [Minwuia thermotolerans]